MISMGFKEDLETILQAVPQDNSTSAVLRHYQQVAHR